MSLTRVTYLNQLPKWTTLSVRKEFVARTENIPVFYEELIKSTTENTLYVELRIDGPFIKTLGSKDEIEATIEVNALLTSHYSEKNPNGLQELEGVVAEALVQDFCVYRLGTLQTDTKEFFETYQLVAEDNIEISRFGQISDTNKIYQTSVEAHYKMRFKNGTVRS